ncbi:hypothetical protein Tco_0327734 [Tanacetum coccineum]
MPISLHDWAEFSQSISTEFLKVYSGCSPRGTLRGLFVFPYRVPNIRSGMARGRLCIAHDYNTSVMLPTPYSAIVDSIRNLSFEVSTITDIKFVLTQKNFDALCRKFHIPEEVHPQLPTPDQTIHDKPEGKIEHYATLVTHPAPFRKFLEVFLSLVGISRYYPLDEETYPSFRDEERKRVGLDNIYCFSSLLAGFVPHYLFSFIVMDLSVFINAADPTLVKVVDVRSEASLEDSVNRLFDEGDNGNQVDSAIGIDQNIVVEPKVKHVAAETEIVKKDYGTSGGHASGGKSPSVIRELLASSILNTEVGVAAKPTLPFVTSSVSATSGNDVPKLLKLGLNLSPDTERPVTASTTQRPGKELSMGSREVDSEALYETFVPRAGLAPPCYLVKSATWISHHLFTEVLMLVMHVKPCLNLRLGMRQSFVLCARTRLEVECGRQASLLKSKDEEIEVLKAHIMVKEAEVAEDIRLCAQIVAMERAHTDEVKQFDFCGCGIEHGKHDASTEAVMNLLRLSDPLANFPRMSDLQPDVEQIMVPIHRPKDQVVLGANSLTFSLSVSRDRVERIRRNIAEHRSVCAGVFTPLAEPFSVQSLTGAANTSDVAPSAAATTTALSTMFASASTILPVSEDDYVVTDVVNEENVQPNVEYKGEGSAAADINFEKEELDTTP